MISYDRRDSARTVNIRSLVEKRGITDLYHFTRIENFPSILRNGLLSVRKMEEQGIKPLVSDTERWDHRLDGISVSISFPNWKMFYRKRINCDRPTHWMVLSINPTILWKHRVEFFSNNAAAGEMIAAERSSHCGAVAFQHLFDGPTRESEDGIPLSSKYPTNNQAEVMVFEPIRQRYIQYCVVGTERIRDRACKLRPPFDVRLSWLKENGQSVTGGVFSRLDDHLRRELRNDG